MTVKHQINLLQDELFPEQPLFTLSRILWLWGLALAVLVAFAFVLSNQENALRQEANSMLAEKRHQQEIISQLEAKLASHKASRELEEKLDTLKTVIKNKRSIYAYLTDKEDSYISGFSQAMSELALMHHKNVSLTEIRITESQLRFGGVARTAGAVPQWLAKFEQSSVLSGKLFNHFELSEGDEKYIEFTVSSSGQKDEN